MNLHIIKDEQAQSDFGYRKVEQYQILVKESVFKQMLKMEYKKPRNWLIMLLQVFRMAFSLFSRSFFASCAITFFIMLFSLSTSEAKEVYISANVLVEMMAVYFDIFKIVMVLFVIMDLCRFGISGVRRTTLAPNNAFTQHIFQQLCEEAAKLEESKNEKNDVA